MDFKRKGITWVGNIYEKFEAMCLEVEDIMSQDTAKYVENQVQNVGGNIKKFCAEVMHDLLPPSSEDPHKVKDSDISVEQNAELRTCKKPKLDAKDNPIKDNAPHKILEVIAPAVKDSSLVSFLSGVPKITHLLPLASVGPAKEANPDLSLEKNDDVDEHKKSKVCIEDDSIEENPPSHEVSEVIGSVGGDSTQASLPIEVEEEDHLIPPSSAYAVKVSGSESPQEQNGYVGMCKKSSVHIGGDSIKENLPPSDASKSIDSAGDVSSRESIFSGLRSENHEKACATLKKMLSQNSVEVTVDNSPNRGVTIDSCILGQSGRGADDPNALFVPPVVLCENKAMEMGVTPSSSILSTEPNVIETLTTFKAMMESSMESSTDGNEQYYKDAELEAFMTPPPEFGRSDDDGLEVEEADDTVGMVMKTIEQFDNVKLEDSCIVVQPFTVSCREGKHRSYKKKIRDAFASRMGSSKKKEYEQLAIWYADMDAGTNQQRVDISTPSTLTKKLDSRSLSTDEFCESEWEIL
ncbi:hypothetical protein BVC80_659g17 [Macleaya cordata]|uniref:Uncharacterized protein n=1 Tax=Macleaya cordata TaxID=56857 RepID=A0A200QFL0_MACCD|nr:hypothetical protein BVC80_659g17 [Macleaya cordata]